MRKDVKTNRECGALLLIILCKHLKLLFKNRSTSSECLINFYFIYSQERFCTTVPIESRTCRIVGDDFGGETFLTFSPDTFFGRGFTTESERGGKKAKRPHVSQSRHAPKTKNSFVIARPAPGAWLHWLQTRPNYVRFFYHHHYYFTSLLLCALFFSALYRPLCCLLRRAN